MAEMIWSKDRQIIELDRLDVMKLKVLMIDFNAELPPLVPEKGAYCYVFPVETEMFFYGEQLTAMLITNSGPDGDIAVVQQFKDSETTAFLFSAAKIAEEANRAITFPPSMKAEDVTEKQKMLLTYYLCNGPKEWEGFCETIMLGDEPDDPADWWKK
jgi:hypothetical protein